MRLHPKLTLIVACTALALVLHLAGPAQAVGEPAEYVFNPTLSLTGDCTTSVLDEKPDPGLCPGVPGVDHPPKALGELCGVAVDTHGYIYVATPAIGATAAESTDGRIDVFNAQGEYLTQIKNPNQPCDLSVDSEGNLYVAEHGTFNVVRYEPPAYPPVKGAEYGPPTMVYEQGTTPGCLGNATGVSVDPSNDHLFVALGCQIAEYDSAANGSTLIPGREKIGFELGVNLLRVATCGVTHDVYTIGRVPGSVPQGSPANSRVFVFDGTDGHKKLEFDGSETPGGGFGFALGQAEIAVNQANCDIYVDDITQKEVVYQFDDEGNYIAQLEHSFAGRGVPQPGLAIDAPFPGQVGYVSPNEGQVYVAQGSGSGSNHLYAFKPRIVEPPAIENQVAIGITETEVVLQADLNPGGLNTNYHFEYITQEAYEAAGEEYGAGTASLPVPDATTGEAGSFALVSQPVTGLQPGTPYRFRLVASNCEAEEAIPGECLTEGEGIPGEEGSDATFATFAPEGGLPDSRAYELVTPPDTNGLIPNMAAFGRNAFSNFGTTFASPDGGSLIFGTEGGSIPALGGGGYHDTYEAVRGKDGWQSRFVGIDGTQAAAPAPGGISADHDFAFWRVNEQGAGSMALGNYLRLPDGSFQPIGLGSLGEDITAVGGVITLGATHVIFETNHGQGAQTIQLEPNAPPTGTTAVYDRSPGGKTHVVSLLPATEPGGETPAAGLDSFYQGASADGSVIAFKTLPSPGIPESESPLYARVDNAETLAVASGKTLFGGISGNGERIVYLRPNATEPQRPNPIFPAAQNFPQGEVFVYDTAAKTTTAIGSGDEAVLVNVSPDGSHIYFDSPEQLDGGQGTLGAENLYVWDLATESVRFVATLTQRDVFGTPTPGVLSQMTDGLGLWINDVAAPFKQPTIGPGADPSRSSADGSILIFESRAALTDYDNGGHAQIYRYDADAPPTEQFSCVSCNPTGVAAHSDAMLQSLPPLLLVSLPPVNSLAEIANLTPDGNRAFFQSADQLAVGDVDGKVDVYEWQAEGIGGCERSGGCIHLISGGRSANDDYLYAVNQNGSDVFFLSGDRLVAGDRDSVPSIYDAREGGGFPEPMPPVECLGEACQPPPAAPDDAVPASSSFEGPGNPKAKPKRRCPAGKRKVRRAGKTRCVKKSVGVHRKGKRAHDRKGVSR
jgi:hypothetical protein